MLPSSAIPKDWRKVDSRKFPGCCYYVKPDGEATWLLPGQAPSQLKKDMQSLYKRDYIYDPRVTQLLNPPSARMSGGRHTSYRVHPKAPVSRDRETYQSVSREDFKKFTSSRPQPKHREPFCSPRFVANSTYRSEYLDNKGASVGDDVRVQEELILADANAHHHTNGGVVDATNAAAIHCSPHQRKQLVVNISRQLQNRSSSSAVTSSPASADVDRRRSGGIFPHHWGVDGGGEEVDRPVFRPSYVPSRPQTAAEQSLPHSARRPFRSRPQDRSHSYHSTPFTSTTDYRANFIDYKPPRPHLHHPQDQVDFGGNWVNHEDVSAKEVVGGGTSSGSVGTQPSSLYRSSFGGKQPPFGRAPKAALHSKMRNLPSHFESRSKAEYCPDEEQSPAPNFRSRLREIDHRVVNRLKAPTDGTTG